MKRLLFYASLGVMTACGAGHPASFGPSKVDIPVLDTSRIAKKISLGTAREMPPPSGATKETPFPAISRAHLGNGMGVAVVTAKALPIVQIRVLIKVGSGGAAPGVAELTASMLKDGGTRSLSSAELLRRVETLGADLNVASGFDETVLGIAVTKDHLGEALGLLSQLVREPRFDEGELKKAKSRASDEAEDAARSSGAFSAYRLLFRDLFGDKHPYGSTGLAPSEIARVDGTAIRDFYRRFYVPKNAELILTGDVDEATAKAAAEENFGKWTGGDPIKITVPPPRAPEKPRVLLAHRPKSVQSDVFVAMLAPERKSAEWAAIRVANQVLGGGVASRLFQDVREQRSLAYSTGSQIVELANGQQPLLLRAGTETGKTSLALTGLLENLAKMRSSPPSPGETENARRYLSDVFAIRMETIGSIADMIVTQDSLGLPDGYWDSYRKELRAIDPARAADAVKKLYPEMKYVIVVAGDADVIGNDLARFGEVTVFDPEKEWKEVRKIPEVTK